MNNYRIIIKNKTKKEQLRVSNKFGLSSLKKKTKKEQLRISNVSSLKIGLIGYLVP